MNVSALEQNSLKTPPDKPSPEALRKAATQFEAVLLMQLTSSLNSTAGDDEDSLFGSDGGSGLSKQMFSEQLATSMAQSGGVGLSDMILKQFGVAGSKPGANAGDPLSNVLSAVKSIKDGSVYTNASNEIIGTSGGSSAPNLKQGKLFSGDPNDAAIISTFEDQARTDGVDESMRSLELDGRIANTTRPRIVPNASISGMPASTTSPVNPSVSPDSVDYHFPVRGRISSGFGNRFHPIDKRVKFHAGIDIAVPIGTPVGAAAQGVVRFSGRDGDYGNLVIIEHPDGRVTRYGHLSKLLVSTGDQVSVGQTVALSGSTGKSTGPHVHFEVRENGQVVNPIKVMSNVLPYLAER
ncbi:MAG: peptidoglycan DD-metalloendopeptidase family protein [Acidobacteriota bacterium]